MVEKRPSTCKYECGGLGADRIIGVIELRRRGIISVITTYNLHDLAALARGFGFAGPAARHLTPRVSNVTSYQSLDCAISESYRYADIVRGLRRPAHPVDIMRSRDIVPRGRAATTLVAAASFP